jgi:hypothetical protein
MKYFFIFVIILSFCTAAQAQEELVPLSSYPALVKHKTPKNMQSTKATPSVILPFIDDFSANSHRPNPYYWATNYAYVNKEFAVNPPTIGVLTFDAVDDSGAVYSHAGQFAFIADTMRSNSIRLDSGFVGVPHSLSPADSVYFSFWFQPQGIGNSPEEEDSLILHFYNPVSGKWKNVWHHEGMPLDTFLNEYGLEFVRVMIPITNPDYFNPNFKFRFINLSSIPNTTIPSWRSGIYDQWHIDYVYLDEGRTYNEVNRNDIAFTSKVSTLLVNYESMPWNQYQANAAGEFNGSATINLRNLDFATPKNVNQYFSVQNLQTNAIMPANLSISTINMNAGAQVSYAPTYNSTVFQSSSTDYIDFEVMFRLLSNTPPMDLIRTNDTMRFYQRFYNYYAYDDGTPEAGYGLSNNGAKLAYQFTLNTPDSLQAIQFYFNQTLGNANQQYFFLTIWDDQGGQPGNIIYQKSGKRPDFADDLFQFVNYELDEAIYLTGTFYVGWQQTTGDNLNVGFDFNNDHHDRIFYNASGSWQQSTFSGSIMIRPVLGKDKEAYVSVPEQTEIEKPHIVVFPNPLDRNETLTILFQEESEMYDAYQLELFDLSGRIVHKQQLRSSNTKIRNLDAGIYILRVINQKQQQIKTQKVVVR